MGLKNGGFDMNMTFEKLAVYVANDFRKTMQEEGFTTFAEMKKCYMWDADDIKTEIYDIITEYAKEQYSKGEYSDFWMWDDMTAVQIGWDDMAWKDFKRLIFKDLK